MDSPENFPQIKRKITTMRQIRSLVFHFLYAVDSFDYSVSVKDVAESFRKGFDLDISEDSKAIKMAEDVIAKKEQLDEKLKPILKNWELKRVSTTTRLILRFALWELEQKDAIDSVIINEAIELAKDFAEKDAYKFINGILDEACKRMKIDK